MKKKLTLRDVSKMLGKAFSIPEPKPAPKHIPSDGWITVK